MGSISLRKHELEILKIGSISPKTCSGKLVLNMGSIATNKHEWEIWSFQFEELQELKVVFILNQGDLYLNSENLHISFLSISALPLLGIRYVEGCCGVPDLKVNKFFSVR